MKKMKLVSTLATYGVNILEKIKTFFKTRILLYQLNKSMHHASISVKLASGVILKTVDELNNFAKCFDNIKEEQETKQIIAVDFDGTLCEDRWPSIGEMNKELLLWLIWRQRHGSSIILWTCREGKSLQEAIDACLELGLTFDSINESLTHTNIKYGGRTRKVYADVYIDDHNSTNYWKLPFHPVNNK